MRAVQSKMPSPWSTHSTLTVNHRTTSCNQRPAACPSRFGGLRLEISTVPHALTPLPKALDLQGACIRPNDLADDKAIDLASCPSPVRLTRRSMRITLEEEPAGDCLGSWFRSTDCGGRTGRQELWPCLDGPHPTVAADRLARPPCIDRLPRPSLRRRLGPGRFKLHRSEEPRDRKTRKSGLFQASMRAQAVPAPDHRPPCSRIAACIISISSCATHAAVRFTIFLAPKLEIGVEVVEDPLPQRTTGGLKDTAGRMRTRGVGLRL